MENALREVEGHGLDGTEVPTGPPGGSFTNEVILFDRCTQRFSQQLAEAVETFRSRRCCSLDANRQIDHGCRLDRLRGPTSTEIPSVEVRGQDDQRHVDGGQAVSEPARAGRCP